MFTLILIVTVLATGQASSPMQHRDSPFPTVEACFAAAAAGDATVRKIVSQQVGSPVSTSYECRPADREASLKDRAADSLQRVLREMNRRGGIAAVPNVSGL